MKQDHAQKVLDFTFRYMVETLAKNNKKQDSASVPERNEKGKNRKTDESHIMHKKR